MMISKKFRYFLGHLACSIMVGLFLVGMVFFVWYPAPLAHAEGVTAIFLMLLAIDVTLGPLLSLLVYKEGKKTLKIDLSVIVLIQVMALSYGVYAIAQSRPAWVVQSGWLFEVVPANAVDVEDQAKAEAMYQSNSFFGPKWVAVNDAKNPNNSLAAPQLMPSTYADLSLAKTRLNQHALALVDLTQFNPKQDVDRILQEYPGAMSWIPLRTTGLGLVVLLDKEYKVIDVVNLRPWQE